MKPKEKLSFWVAGTSVVTLVKIPVLFNSLQL